MGENIVKVYVDLEGITGLMTRAAGENRDYLFEHEVYELVRLLGGETPLKYYLLEKGARVMEERLSIIPGDKLVLKVVSPFIPHKSDVGGVRIVEKKQEAVLSTVRSMMYEVPEKFADLIEKNPSKAPAAYQNLSGEKLVQAIGRDICGVLVCQFLPIDPGVIGNELLVSIRRTREFGMILTTGLGGTDTELYAERFSKGRAFVTASTEMVDGEAFFELYKRTFSYEKLTGQTRAKKRLVTDEQLIECFEALCLVANYFSPLNPEAPFVIEELEVNPFAFSKYLMVPLDGLCRFSRPVEGPVKRPIEKIEFLLHPSSIGIIGASARSSNIGRIILKNILANGFDPSAISVVHPQADAIEGIRPVRSLDSIGRKLDLLVLAVGAEAVTEIIDDVILNDRAESVILIPGGLGEKRGSEDLGLDIWNRISKAHMTPGRGPVFLGGNSMGVLSHPGRYDSFFITDDKLPKTRGTHLRHSAFISQSGAFMAARMSRMPFLDPAYALSIGNQIDLTASDLLSCLSTFDEIRAIGIYMEGFRDLDGLEFAKIVRNAVINGKDIIFYKAGRTAEGMSATSGHTASIAGDYAVCESCIREAGAMVARTFTSFEGLLMLATCLHDREINGNRLAAISNAGYESVGIADNILGDDFKLEMVALSDSTRMRIAGVLKEGRLEKLVDVKNPMDINPMADAEVYEKVIRAMLEADCVDAVIVAMIPLTPAIQTLPGGKEPLDSENSLVKRLSRIAESYKKPVVMVLDSGSLFDSLADAFQSEGFPVFRSADQAVQLLGEYLQVRLRAMEIAGGRQNRTGEAAR